MNGDYLKLTEQEKALYNKYLKITRLAQKKPFKYRKNFDDMDMNTVYALKKLNSFFYEFESINIDEYFKAPYVIYDDIGHIGIEFYTKSKARKAYTHLQKTIATADPDTKYVMRKFVDSLSFLRKYCREHDIKLDDYLSYKEENSKIESFLIHLKNKKISFYTICALTTSGGCVKSDSVDLLFPNFYEILSMCRGKFMKSEKLRLLAKKGINKIKQ